MNIVEIIRLESSNEGTFGILRINKVVFCATLEPRENANLHNISCIPAQPYTVKITNSPKFGITYQVLDVPERSHILFHAGNEVKHTAGCIILGQHITKLQGNRALYNSGLTFQRFLIRLDSLPFKLIIYDFY